MSAVKYTNFVFQVLKNSNNMIKVKSNKVCFHTKATRMYITDKCHKYVQSVNN